MVWSRGQGSCSKNNQVKEGCVKPGGGTPLLSAAKESELLPCVNVEVNESSSVLCHAWKNTGAGLASCRKAKPRCQSVSTLGEPVQEERVSTPGPWGLHCSAGRLELWISPMPFLRLQTHLKMWQKEPFWPSTVLPLHNVCFHETPSVGSLQGHRQC